MTTQPTPKGAWRITFLLFLFMLVNFADKIVVGLAGVPIMTELKLEPEQFGLARLVVLLPVFDLGDCGRLHCQSRRDALGPAGAGGIWALVQFPMVGTVGFTTLLICRIILGAGEGPAFSVAAHAIYKWFPDEKRTLPTAILSQGSAFGVIIAVPALNWVIVNYTWHYAFGALGVVGLMWVLAWLIWARKGRWSRPWRWPRTTRVFPTLRLFTSRTFIGCCVGNVRSLLGVVAGSHLVHALYCQGPRLLADRTPAGFRSCRGCSARRSCC